MTPRDTLIHGDALEELAKMPASSARCCITSPPYWGLRDYGHEGQIGLETTPEAFVARMVDVFREVRRVLADDGTLWLNLGDSYAANGVSGLDVQTETSTTGKANPRGGLKQKDLVGIPWRVAFALQADGWYLRSDIIWSKPNPMPESVTDRPTKAHEYVFLLSKSPRYYYNAQAIAEHDSGRNSGNGFAGRQGGARSTAVSGGNGREAQHVGGGMRNRRTVWAIPTQPFPGAHFAVMPTALVEPCILAGTEPDDVVLDPFAGAATVGVVARKHRRRFVGIELNPEYAEMARGRLGIGPGAPTPLFNREVPA